MTRCIYDCGREADSREDWLPRGFGVFKDMTLLHDRLCERCNNELGHALDQEILRTGPTGLLKSILEIEGRHKGPSPNIFHYKVMGAESTTYILMPCPYGDYNIFGETFTAEDGQPHVYPLRQLVFKKGDEMVCVPFPPAYDAGRLLALIEARGVKDSTLEAVYLSRTESPEDIKVRQLLSEALGQFSATAYGGIGDSGGRKDVLMAAGISKAYVRGLAKMAFHYYLWSSKDHTGHELIFQPIRRFIREGMGDSTSFVHYPAPQIIAPLREGNAPEAFSHFFSTWKKGNSLYSLAQFFVGPEHLTPPAVVVLGLTKVAIEERTHWIAYYGEKVDQCDGAIMDITRRD